jgi:hypothetical protein
VRIEDDLFGATALRRCVRNRLSLAASDLSIPGEPGIAVLSASINVTAPQRCTLGSKIGFGAYDGS